MVDYFSGTVDTFTYEYVNKPSHRRLELPQHWPFGKPVLGRCQQLLMKPRTDYKAHFWATTKTTNTRELTGLVTCLQ